MDFHHGEREFLVANRALIMVEGLERYVGLTEADSFEYPELSLRNETGSLDSSGRNRFDELHRKHETERQVYVRGAKFSNVFKKP
jgi:hypothetical protein